jgi:hypothetical protein
MSLFNYDEIRDTVSSWSPFHLTNKQIDAVLDSSDVLKAEITAWGICDTCSREMFFEYFAKMLVGRPWPLNKDNDPTFFAELANAARAAGIVIKDER